jgi:hypothetical protein
MAAEAEALARAATCLHPSTLHRVRTPRARLDRQPRNYRPNQPSHKLKRSVGMGRLSRSVRQSGDPPDVFVGANVKRWRRESNPPKISTGTAGAR